uniref:Uncharacterized protein n=1 Tax=Rhizophora mucronata TaxID=61149 RepID=A0A2P2NUR4_RHIMU
MCMLDSQFPLSSPINCPFFSFLKHYANSQSPTLSYISSSLNLQEAKRKGKNSWLYTSQKHSATTMFIKP